jgi:ABC-type antimicrobial peptide transport system permease subunit
LTSLPSTQIKIKDRLKELVQICFIKRMANVDTFLMFNPLFSLYCFVDHCLFSSYITTYKIDTLKLYDHILPLTKLIHITYMIIYYRLQN